MMRSAPKVEPLQRHLRQLPPGKLIAVFSAWLYGAPPRKSVIGKSA
jgi:hypothetical protein